MHRRTRPITSKPKSLTQEKADFTAEGAPVPNPPPVSARAPEPPPIIPAAPGQALPSGGAD